VGWTRFIARVGVLWLMSLVVAIAVMELGHRMVLSIDHVATPEATEEQASAVSVGDEQAPPILSTTKF
jgi:hypothetical protein